MTPRHFPEPCDTGDPVRGAVSPRIARRMPLDQGAARRRLANRLETERSCHIDREAMLAALRVAAGLPKQLPGAAAEGRR